MIGGIDIQLPTFASSQATEVAVRVIRQWWRSACFENGITGERYDHFWQIPFNNIDELFVYRDSECADTWDTEGAVPAVYNTMIHLIRENDLLMIVIDEKDDVMEELLAAIKSGLCDEIFYLLVEDKAA